MGIKKLSTGHDSTLGNYRDLAYIFGGFCSSVLTEFIDKKIAESPEGENTEVIADETQMILLFAEMLDNEKRRKVELENDPTPKLITTNRLELSNKMFIEPFNDLNVKPGGGLWASTYHEGRKYKSDWHRFSEEDLERRLGGKPSVIFKLKYEANVYTIDTYRDLEHLMTSYCIRPFENLEYSSLISYLDFERLSCEYDAIHLTTNGQHETRLSQPYNLYGWDVESYLILNFNCIDLESQETVIL